MFKYKDFCVAFITENIFLIGLAVGSGVMLLVPSMGKSSNGVPNLASIDAVTLINRSHAVVIDVRDEQAFAAGHIAEAKNIPLEALESRLKELNKYKNKPILVNCQKGVAGVKACDILKKAEFNNVNHLKGGLDAWVNDKLLIVK